MYMGARRPISELDPQIRIKMSSSRIDCYWSERFGLEPFSLYQSGIFVVPHARPWKDSFAFVFVRGTTGVISVSPTLVDSIRVRLHKQAPVSLLDAENLRPLFEQPIHHTVGPSYQGYAEREHFLPISSESVRRLSPNEREALEQLKATCDPTEWEQSGTDRADSDLFGLFSREELVAVAHYAIWAEAAASIGVLTHPAHRGQNSGKAIVSAAMQDAFTRGYLVLYQALFANRPSVAVATTLGFQAYAQTLGVHLVEGGV